MDGFDLIVIRTGRARSQMAAKATDHVQLHVLVLEDSNAGLRSVGTYTLPAGNAEDFLASTLGDVPSLNPLVDKGELNTSSNVSAPRPRPPYFEIPEEL